MSEHPTKAETKEYMEAASTAYAALDGAIDGIIGTIKHQSGNASASVVFFAMETALLQHAVRLVLFSNKVLEQDMTAAKFGEFAREIFTDISKLGIQTEK